MSAALKRLGIGICGGFMGNPVITTIFPVSGDTSPGSFYAVNSRHFFTILSDTPFPSQYYGTCKVLE